MLGFGFNKDKTRAAAENYVRQGRITNAIAEYDKILRQDPGDLTVLNTVGDLYASLKRNEEAVAFFRQVGENYASEGFVPRAIAIYKKIVKLAPDDMEFVVKLGDLYTQQGLYNDARTQYMLAAESLERNSRLAEAIKCYQRILDLDPENGAVLGRMAKLQKKSGNADEATKLLYESASALRSRGQQEAADEALVDLLAIDAHHQQALLMRAELAIAREDRHGAIAMLGRLENLQKNPEALSLLLDCHVVVQDFDEAEADARTLLEAQGEVKALYDVIDPLMDSNAARALALYREFSERLIEDDIFAYIEHLAQSFDLLRNDLRSLQELDELLAQAGAHQERIRTLEMIASLREASNDAANALLAYKTLNELAPENPSYAQKCRQLVMQVGGVAAEAISAEASSHLERPAARELPDESLRLGTPAVAPIPPTVETLDFEIPGPAEDSFSLPGDISAESAPKTFDIAAPPAFVAPPAPFVDETADAPEAESGEIPEFDLAVVAPPPVAPLAEAKESEADPEAPRESAAPAALDLSQEWRNEAEIADLIEEIRFYLSQSMWSEADFACQRLAERAPDNKHLAELQAQAKEGLATTAEVPEEALEAIDTIEVDAPPEEIAEEIQAPEAAAPTPSAEVAEPSFDDFLQELDDSLADDFHLSEKTAETPARPPAPKAEVPTQTPSAAPEPRVEAAAEPEAGAPDGKPLVAEEESNGLLNELFEEFKDELGEDSSAEEDDPETRYNLASAFREMGLLDEAIGELQKVCQAVERGHAFPQALQAYTWLAHCFVQKGVPEASFRWYQKALELTGDEASRTAIHYELADAYESAGLKQEALRHFLEAYASNIDFRDVGERIRALRS